MAVLVIGQLALGLRIVTMTPGLSGLWLYGLHKTMGTLVLVLIVLRLQWHVVSPVPLPLGPPGLPRLAARGAHRLFYGLLIALPLTGWAGSSATGLDIVIAERWILPPIISPSEAAEAFWFGMHGALAWALVALIALHVAGALLRARAGDGTLRRMLRGRV